MDQEGKTGTSATSRQLIARARAGDSRAISELFARQGTFLRGWAKGRLPRWARSLTDTADVVQDVLLNTFRRLDRFEDRGKGALRAYLRTAVVNRINDEMRKVGRRPTSELRDDELELRGDDPSPFQAAADAEQERQYKTTLATISEDERVLIVGRLELGYTYEQLALISGRATPDAARLAVRRAVARLAEKMGNV